jgi:hypothetical protein
MPYNSVDEMRENYAADGAARLLFGALVELVDACMEPVTGADFICSGCESADPDSHGGGCPLQYAIGLVGTRVTTPPQEREGKSNE